MEGIDTGFDLLHEEKPVQDSKRREDERVHRFCSEKHD